jgi:hypothetical protein
MCTVKKALRSIAPSRVVTMSPADTSGRICCFSVSHTQASNPDNLSNGQRIAAGQAAAEDSADHQVAFFSAWDCLIPCCFTS